MLAFLESFWPLFCWMLLHTIEAEDQFRVHILKHIFWNPQNDQLWSDCKMTLYPCTLLNTAIRKQALSPWRRSCYHYAIERPFQRLHLFPVKLVSQESCVLHIALRYKVNLDHGYHEESSLRRILLQSVWHFGRSWLLRSYWCLGCLCRSRPGLEVEKVASEAFFTSSPSWPTKGLSRCRPYNLELESSRRFSLRRVHWLEHHAAGMDAPCRGSVKTGGILFCIPLEAIFSPYTLEDATMDIEETIEVTNLFLYHLRLSPCIRNPLCLSKTKLPLLEHDIRSRPRKWRIHRTAQEYYFDTLVCAHHHRSLPSSKRELSTKSWNSTFWRAFSEFFKMTYLHLMTTLSLLMRWGSPLCTRLSFRKLPVSFGYGSHREITPKTPAF